MELWACIRKRGYIRTIESLWHAMHRQGDGKDHNPIHRY